jgi:la-related protein 4
MRGFELEPGSFFMCTETSPRCFIIQQVNDLDQALSDVKTSTEHDAPMLPFLPWWFTSECRQQLLSVPNESATHLQSGQSGERSGTPDPNQMTPEQLKARLKTQLEYYFSRENLITDRFLRCQMDADQYVPVKILASFPKIAALTSDTKMITEVLKESAQVQVDEIGEKVRPVTKRCTIILREIPENADEKEVKSMFDGCPPYRSLFYGLNNSWYVTFDTEEATQKAFLHLQNLGKTFNNKPVYVSTNEPFSGATQSVTTAGSKF